MPQPILLTASEPGAGHFWCLDPERPDAGARRDAPERLASQYRFRPACLVVPGTEVLLTHVRLPDVSRNRLRNAVPYALEADLSADVDSLQFALGAREDDKTPVAVMAKSALEAWLAAARPFEPCSIVPETLLVPWQPGQCGIIFDGTTALVRLGRSTGFASERANLLRVLKAALAESEPVERIELMAVPDAGTALDELVVELTGLGIPVQTRLERRDKLDWLAQALDDRPPVDLLHQEQPAGDPRRGRVWIQALWLALLLGGTLALGAHLESQRLEDDIAALDARIDASYAHTLAGTGADESRAASLRGYLDARFHSETRGTEQLLELLDALSSGLTGIANTSVVDLDYSHGQLRVTLALDNLSQLERLERGLGRIPAVHTETEAASAAADGSVQARLTLASRRP